MGQNLYKEPVAAVDSEWLSDTQSVTHGIDCGIRTDGVTRVEQRDVNGVLTDFTVSTINVPLPSADVKKTTASIIGPNNVMFSGHINGVDDNNLVVYGTNLSVILTSDPANGTTWIVGGHGEESSAVAAPVILPVVVTPPSITGGNNTGETITITPAVWDSGTAVGVLTIGGINVTANIVGGVYTIPLVHDGKQVVYTETNGGVTSSVEIAADFDPIATAAPVISSNAGTAEGDVITITPAIWDTGAGVGQLIIGDTDVTADIVGLTYTVPLIHANKGIQWFETNDATTVSSNKIDATFTMGITNSPDPVATSVPTLTSSAGTAENDVLTVTPAVWDTGVGVGQLIVGNTDVTADMVGLTYTVPLIHANKGAQWFETNGGATASSNKIDATFTMDVINT